MEIHEHNTIITQKAVERFNSTNSGINIIIGVNKEAMITLQIDGTANREMIMMQLEFVIEKLKQNPPPTEIISFNVKDELLNK